MSKQKSPAATEESAGLQTSAKAKKPEVGSQKPGELPGELIRVRLEDLEPAQDQPRTLFDDDKLDDLGASLKEFGQLQPIVIRRDPNKIGMYRILVGERRFRAALDLGWTHLNAIVNDADLDADRRLLMQLAENAEREHLTPIEEGKAYQRLIEHGHKVEALAKQIRKSVRYIYARVELLGLHTGVQELLEKRLITPGHAECLMPLSGDKQIDLARTIVDHDYSVRELRAALTESAHGEAQAGTSQGGGDGDADDDDLTSKQRAEVMPSAGEASEQLERDAQPVERRMEEKAGPVADATQTARQGNTVSSAIQRGVYRRLIERTAKSIKGEKDTLRTLRGYFSDVHTQLYRNAPDDFSLIGELLPTLEDAGGVLLADLTKLARLAFLLHAVPKRSELDRDYMEKLAGLLKIKLSDLEEEENAAQAGIPPGVKVTTKKPAKAAVKAKPKNRETPYQKTIRQLGNKKSKSKSKK